MQDAIEIEVVLTGNHVELIDRGELQIAPGVGHQLADLGFHRLHLDQLGAEASEQFLHSLEGRVVERTDDLRQRTKLLQALPLRHALRAEGDADLLAGILEMTLQVRAHAGEDGRAQHQHLTVAEVRQTVLDRPVERPQRRVQVRIDRRADDHHHELAFGQPLGRGRQFEASARQHLGQQLVGAVLQERHPPGAHLLHLRAVEIDDQRPQTGIGERQSQRQADMAATADHRHVTRESNGIVDR